MVADEIAAVSLRSIVLVRLQGRKPLLMALSISDRVNPPSGPITICICVSGIVCDVLSPDRLSSCCTNGGASSLAAQMKKALPSLTSEDNFKKSSSSDG